jgi:ABC-type Zn uptake system ZnuABC Zn-binding protein ZnuA
VLRLTTTLVVLAGVLALAACGRDEPAGAGDAALRVVATTAHTADFARAVGGDRVAVEAILPANADPHDFEPRPSDARAVAEADIVVRSGGDLDAWLGALLDNAGGDAERVVLMDAVETIPGGHDHEAGEAHEAGEDEAADPHWWQDPRNVVRAVERLREAFAAADPDGAATYAANARRYASQVERLDRAIERCMRRVPAERRTLVTGHDAFGYFAHRYDLELLGSILPSLSTSAQPSAADVRRLVEAIRREGVTTIFPESALDTRLERAVARDAGAEVGEPLYADTLGAGDREVTYLEALRHDATLVAESFGARCDLEAGR